ncbi:hypothetical protein DUNSADRAFT_14733 [Dunaliella salina]|uniref:Encoded protein n=1 Tax=Dunaliella salina TaxID=3046 RepID=A0ABZ3LHX8_DUNSA|nr:hypothetical protein DUNSADRAFT_14733 [Dunaliella salina]|eukprot:KAF5841026.1 hypothetical protein DUNSADRAFT_14733 [Dunaliella salina]
MCVRVNVYIFNIVLNQYQALIAPSGGDQSRKSCKDRRKGINLPEPSLPTPFSMAHSGCEAQFPALRLHFELKEGGGREVLAI